MITTVSLLELELWMVRHSLDKITTQLGLDKCSFILDKVTGRVISGNTKVKFEKEGIKKEG